MKYSEWQNKASYHRNAWWFEPGRQHGRAPGWDTARDGAPQPSVSPPHWKTQEHAPTIVTCNGLWLNQALELPIHTEKHMSIHSLWLNQALELPLHDEKHTGMHPSVVTCHNLWSTQALVLPLHTERHISIHSLRLNQRHMLKDTQAYTPLLSHATVCGQIKPWCFPFTLRDT